MPPSSTFSSALRFPRRGALALTAIASLLATGCVFDSPYWAQTFASTTTPIPIQTWTTDKTLNVKIECSKAYHGGLYPFGGPETWTLVTNLTPSTQASYDPLGYKVYSAGTSMVLPAACWHPDAAYSPPKPMTALRATQTSASGTVTTYRVFDAAGLECLGREIGKGKNWFAWLGKNCALNYANSSTPLPWVKIIAESMGAAAMAAPASMARALVPAEKTTAAPTESQAVLLAQAFDKEGIDAAWAPGLEARLRAAFDKARPKGSQLLGLACRSSLCRVTVAHTDEAAQLRFVAAMAPLDLLSNDGQRGAVVHTGSGAGAPSLYYIGRDGQALPGGAGS